MLWRLLSETNTIYVFLCWLFSVHCPGTQETAIGRCIYVLSTDQSQVAWFWFGRRNDSILIFKKVQMFIFAKKMHAMHHMYICRIRKRSGQWKYLPITSPSVGGQCGAPMFEGGFVYFEFFIELFVYFHIVVLLYICILSAHGNLPLASLSVGVQFSVEWGWVVEQRPNFTRIQYYFFVNSPYRIMWGCYGVTSIHESLLLGRFSSTQCKFTR